MVNCSYKDKNQWDEDTELNCNHEVTSASVFAFTGPSSGNNWEDVQAKARRLLMHTHGLSRCTVQVQTYQERLETSCVNCRQSIA